MCQQSAQQKTHNSLKIIDLLEDFIQTTHKRGIFVERCSERVKEIDAEFRNYGFTAHEFLNVFCRIGLWPEDPFGFLAAYFAKGVNISYEQELWDIDRKVRESRVAYDRYVEKQYAEIKRICAQGFDHDTCNQDGNNLLIMASAVGSISLVEDVLASSPNIDINVQNVAGWTALSLAVVLGQCDSVALLLQHGANPLATCNEARLTEIICACDNWPERETRKQKIAELLAHAIPHESFSDVGPRSASS